MAGRDFGGEMRLRLADGRAVTLRAAITVGSSGTSAESVTNQDGSVSRTFTPRPRTAELTIEDDGIDVNQLLRAARQDVYITEEQVGVSHIYIGAIFTGDPRSNRGTGEITGLVIEANGYERLG